MNRLRERLAREYVGNEARKVVRSNTNEEYTHRRGEKMFNVGYILIDEAYVGDYEAGEINRTGPYASLQVEPVS